jgi:uncharacterized protein YebE (UPF0316 family)
MDLYGGRIHHDHPALVHPLKEKIAMGFNTIYSWVILPLLIFLARITDVTLGTVRFIFISRGYRKLAPLLGFVEVLVWVLAVREVMMNLHNILCLLAYGSGFAMGNYVGMWVEEKLSLGVVLVRVVMRSDPGPLKEFMRQNDYGFTMVEGEGIREKVKILFSVIKRKDLVLVLNAIAVHNPNAFYSVENVKSVSKGVFPGVESSVFSMLFRKHRKSK